MKQELQSKLVAAYPKIFRDIDKSEMVTSMCWGVECGSGWYNLIDTLCRNIQSRIDNQRRARASAIQYNRVLKRALNHGDKSGLIWFFTFLEVSERTHWLVDQAIAHAKFREVPEKPWQVVAVQVKEKLGSLRFYVDCSSDADRAVMNFAESMSCHICEVCGNSGRMRGRSWYKTVCEDHAVELGYDDDIDEPETSK